MEKPCRSLGSPFLAEFVLRIRAKSTVGALPISLFGQFPTWHSGEAFPTVAHLPKLGHIGKSVNARGFTYATCCALQPLVERQRKGRWFGIVYC